jgi:hypothetical protein
MGIVAHPAGKILTVACGMNTAEKFLFDSLKMKYGIIFIASVTIHTGKARFHSQGSGMRE